MMMTDSASNSARFQIHNAISELPGLTEGVHAFLEERVPPAAVFAADLVLEELITNVIKYAYPDGADRMIQVEMSIHEGKLAIAIVDDGQPFDPLSAPPAVTEGGIEDRPIGGLGLHMVRSVTDHFAYCRRDGLNRVDASIPLLPH